MNQKKHPLFCRLVQLSLLSSVFLLTPFLIASSVTGQETNEKNHVIQPRPKPLSNIQISLNETDLTLSKLGRILSEKAKIKTKVLEPAGKTFKPVDITVTRIPVSSILSAILHPMDLRFLHSGKILYIYSPSQTALPKVRKTYRVHDLLGKSNYLPPANMLDEIDMLRSGGNMNKGFQTLWSLRTDLDNFIRKFCSGTVKLSNNRLYVEARLNEHQRVRKCLRQLRTLSERRIRIKGTVFRIPEKKLRFRGGAYPEKRLEEMRSRLQKNGTRVHMFSKQMKSGVPVKEERITSVGYLKDIDPQVATSRVMPDPNISALHSGTGLQLLGRLNERGTRLQLGIHLIQNSYSTLDKQLIIRKIGEFGEDNNSTPVPRDRDYVFPVRREERTNLNWSFLLSNDQFLLLNAGPTDGNNNESYVLLLNPSFKRSKPEAGSSYGKELAREQLINQLESVSFKSSKFSSPQTFQKIAETLRNKGDANVYLTSAVKDLHALQEVFGDHDRLSGYALLKALEKQSMLRIDLLPKLLVMRKAGQNTAVPYRFKIMALYKQTPLNLNIDEPEPPTSPSDTDPDLYTYGRRGRSFLGGSFTDKKDGGRFDKQDYYKSLVQKLSSINFGVNRGFINRFRSFLVVQQNSEILRKIQKTIDTSGFFPRKNQYLQVSAFRFPTDNPSEFNGLLSKNGSLTEEEKKLLIRKLEHLSGADPVGTWTLTPGNREFRYASNVTSYIGVVDYDLQVATATASYDPLIGQIRTGIRLGSRIQSDFLADKTGSTLQLEIKMSRKEGPVKAVDNVEAGQHLAMPLAHYEKSFSWRGKIPGTYVGTFHPYSPNETYLVIVTAKSQKP